MGIFICRIFYCMEKIIFWKIDFLKFYEIKKIVFFDCLLDFWMLGPLKSCRACKKTRGDKRRAPDHEIFTILPLFYEKNKGFYDNHNIFYNKKYLLTVCVGVSFVFFFLWVCFVYSCFLTKFKPAFKYTCACFCVYIQRVVFHMNMC